MSYFDDNLSYKQMLRLNKLKTVLKGTTVTTNDERMTDKNREFAELVGLHICKESKSYPGTCRNCKEIIRPLPDFSADSRLVLREMRKRSDFGSFIKWVCGDHCSQGVRIAELVTDTTGLLRDKAIEWMKGGER